MEGAIGKIEGKNRWDRNQTCIYLYSYISINQTGPAISSLDVSVYSGRVVLKLFMGITVIMESQKSKYMFRWTSLLQTPDGSGGFRI